VVGEGGEARTGVTLKTDQPPISNDRYIWGVDWIKDLCTRHYARKEAQVEFEENKRTSSDNCSGFYDWTSVDVGVHESRSIAKNHYDQARMVLQPVEEEVMDERRRKPQ